MIQKNSPLPIYYQLEEGIKEAIQQQQLMPGEMIPSEREYAEKYGISRMTVRQALSNLVNDGYLYRQRGKGTFVAHQKIEQPLQGLTSFSEDMRSRGLVPSTRVISFKEVEASIDLAAKLEVKAGAPLFELKRVRLADQLPMAYEMLYISKELAHGLTEEIAVNSIYDYVENKLGLKIQHGRQVLEASFARKTEAEMLEVAEGAPVLLIERRTTLDTNKPLEVVRSVYRADRYKFTIDMERF
ncbi:GntR family transcriptional regulator [Metabacillus idriensis]|jgi:GntR family transcriptional regulator|uniref:UTRA domain-containing protein n=1 Tax=Metabacillus idriensis TaxID=324768 RepID=A0A6I2M4V7_9BACI|nr:GntR family transcriptional regulator [Metabacillus idriensis]MCM3594830.1 GntR family transcriptional regulator [Metabacillus idriensis]MRX53148.1 UTRA domain-containing protein [Metabacillus idriensis]OHR66188.1 phosphonate metabolism transcriptional regulator PhnF [Bacillus sp. HMSC76G11]